MFFGYFIPVFGRKKGPFGSNFDLFDQVAAKIGWVRSPGGSRRLITTGRANEHFFASEKCSDKNWNDFWEVKNVATFV
jgi:hypothetical protein